MKFNRKRKIKKYFLHYPTRVAYTVDTSRDPRACSDTAYRTEWRVESCSKEVYEQYFHIKNDYNKYTTMEISTEDVSVEESYRLAVIVLKYKITKKNYSDLVYGVKACDVLIEEKIKLKNDFLANPEDMYSEKFIAKKIDEIERDIKKYQTTKDQIVKAIEDYDNKVKAKTAENNRKEAEFQNKKIQTVTKCPTCGENISGIYNNKYCGSCGTEIPWKILLK